MYSTENLSGKLDFCRTGLTVSKIANDLPTNFEKAIEGTKRPPLESSVKNIFLSSRFSKSHDVINNSWQSSHLVFSTNFLAIYPETKFETSWLSMSSTLFSISFFIRSKFSF